ncbi:MAG TPA: hypothetical protein DDY98_05660 [Ruminococcaceae bacterium]|nr:hypothetical protein [Oscillospiraceae bacterium]
MQITKMNLKPFYALWLVMTAAYAVWMAFFLKFDTYPGNETGINGSVGRYIAWGIFSVVALLLFQLYIKLFFGEKKPGKGLRLFCLINLLFGFAFITWYGFFRNPLELTASMIGLEFPWHFKMWGLFASLSIFTNVLYAYRMDNYCGKLGITCGSIGCAAIFVTINVPSAGEDLILNSLRCMSHWTGALLFAFLGAGSIVIFLLHKTREKNIRYTIVTVLFGAVLALMLVLLVTVGKNGLIESLPMWAAYLVLFLINFTGLFRTKESPVLEQPKEAVTK